MRSPEILNPSGMTPVGIMHPSKLSVELSLKGVSSAKAEMPIEQAVEFGTWVKIYYPNGESGIYRASAPEKDFDRESATVTFDHGVKTLADNIVNIGDTYDDDGVSQPTYFEGTVTQVFTRMLGYQKATFWQFGTTATNENIKVEVDFDNLLSLMNETMQQLPQYYIDYDQSVFPWRVNIKQYPTTVKSEGRLSRNVRTAKVRYDDSDLVTRVYCEALDAGHLDSPNVSLYGIREASYYLNDVDNSFAVKACQNYLSLRDKPKCNVTIEGADFSDITGVSIDKLLIGDLYRLVIPEYDTIIEEQITGINYVDICNRPYELTLSISRERDDLSTAMAAVRAKTNKNARSQSKAASKVYHVYEKLVDEGVVVTEHGEVLRRAGIQFDENGVMIFAKEMGLDEVEKLSGAFKVTAERLTSDYTNKITDTESHITQTASEIRSEVADNKADVQSEIRQTASQILLKVDGKSRVYYGSADPVGSNDVQEEDLWVKSNDIRKYGDAETSTWGDLGQYKWSDFYGAEIYVRKNGVWKKAASEQLENINRTMIDQTDEHIALIAENFDGNWGAFVVEADRIKSEVRNLKSDMGSVVEQTAEMIRSAVFTANSALYSEIKQTATQIYSHVEDENQRIESHINQTASGIWTEVGIRAKVFHGWNDPSTDETTRDHVADGDLWVKDNKIHTYSDAETKTWGNLGEFDWIDFYGCTIYVWNGEKWNEIGGDQLQKYEHTFTEENRELFRKVAQDLAGNEAELKLTKSQFSTRIKDAEDRFGSSITQTAQQIRSEVHTANSAVYSEIKQTSTQIYQHVADEVQGLDSSISVERGRISLVVKGTGSNAKIKPAEIVSSINDGESTIVISAEHVNLSGYVKASDLTADYLKTKIGMATQINTQKLNANTVTILPDGFDASINVATGIKEVRISDPTSNTYKLQYKQFNQKTWQDAGSFSRAVSSWSVAGANGKITVTASPQSQSKEVACQIDGVTSITANGDYYFKGQYQNASGTYSDIGGDATKKVTVNVASPSVSISIPTVEFSTGKPSQVGTYTNTETINKLLREKSGGYIYFQVSAGGTTRWYRITTPK